MRLNKRVITHSLILFLLGALVYAEAPELRNVIPNSWRKITRLSPAEESVFLREQSGSIGQIQNTFRGHGNIFSYPDLQYFFVYRQNIGEDMVYRIICTYTETPDFLSKGVEFFQGLVYKNRLIMISGYNMKERTQRATRTTLCSIDIIEGRQGIKGILLTYMWVTVDDDSFDFVLDSNKQISGRPTGFYFLKESLEMRGELKSAEDYFYGIDVPYITINASPCLVDPNIPLRYSLQSAFDGDPATSFVENSTDDMMRIQVYRSPTIIQRFAVINGYAQNMALYKKNNRIKGIELLKHHISKIDGLDVIDRNVDRMESILSDDTLIYQFVDTDGQALQVFDIYKGSDYNDTCIAEFNMYTTQHGWLFGDIDE